MNATHALRKMPRDVVTDPLDIQNPTWTRDRVLAVAIALPVTVLLFVFLDGYHACLWTVRGILPVAMIWFPDFLGTTVARMEMSSSSSRFEPAAEVTVAVLGWICLLLWAVLALFGITHA